MEMDKTFIYLFILFYHECNYVYKFNFTDCGKISKLHQASWYFGMDSRLVKTFKMTEKNVMQDLSLTTHLDYVAIWKEGEGDKN